VNWLVAGIVTIAAVEIFLRLPLVGVGRRLLQCIQRGQRIIYARKASDHWKQKALLAYSWRIAVDTLRLGVLMLGGMIPVVIATILLDLVLSPGQSTYHLMSSAAGAVFCSVVAVAYWPLRKRLVSQRL
jgi:hypothetical protein